MSWEVWTMRSRTSFFNLSVLRKDISRFFPVWVLYYLFLIVAVSTLALSGGPVLAVFRLNELLPAMSYVCAVYAGLVVMVMFGDLYVPRMCNALHAMPMRREGWFLTHCTAGLLFFAVPNLMACLVIMPLLGSCWYLAWVAYLISLLQYLFFFGLGVFCAMIVGNRFAMVLFYCIFNAFAMIFMWAARIFYQPVLYGIQLREVSFRFFCPVLHMASEPYLLLRLAEDSGSVSLAGLTDGSWQYLLACAGLGILLTGLALLMYRRRALETAGDFISFRPMAPIFLAIYTLAISAMLYAFTAPVLHEYTYIMLLLGVVVGFFTGQMMLSKSVKVFRLKVFLGFAAMLTVFGVTLGVLWLDPVGLVNYLPKLSKVDSVTISTSNMIYYEEFQGEADQLTLTDKADIQSILDLHKLMLEQPVQSDEPEGDFTVFLEYHMENGDNIRRNYPVSAGSREGQLLRSYFSSWQCVFQTDDWEAFTKSVTEITTTGGIRVPVHLIGPVLQAMYQDCSEGNLAQSWNLYQFAPAQERVSITCQENGVTKTLVLRVYDFCQHTLKLLDPLRQTR